MKAVRLRTEYLKHPLGIDCTNPRLFWNCEDGITQTAFQIVCRDADAADDSVLWDSGKVEAGTMHGDYAGAALKSRTCVFWKVRLWDENHMAGPWSEEAYFEIGLLSPQDWQARWIAGDYRVRKKERYPVDCFLRKIHIPGPVVRARLYITACGLYEARLDDRKIGHFCLAPGHTDYRKRVQYQTCDVTDLLQTGDHQLTIELADGWYRGSCGAWGLKNQYGTQTKCLAQLEIRYADGTTQIIGTDETWQWSNDGPVRFADNKDGEVVEAFRMPSFCGKARATAHNVVPSASDNVPVTEHERFKPELILTPSGKTVLDFGQNIAGYVEFTVQAVKGQHVFLRFGELLDGNGEFTQENIQCSNQKITTPLQQVQYWCRDGENRYKTRFAVFGFRYVLLETEAAFRPEDFTAIAVYSDLEPAGSFESSSPLLNQFVEATIWSAKGNFLDVPTDCPTRERHGWTGDAQIFFDTAGYLFDVETFFRKYLRDMYDWQRKSGRLPQIAPSGGVDFYMWVMNGSVGWSDAGILIPYRFWKLYGDARILQDLYPGMKQYAQFMIKRCGKWGGPYARPLPMNHSLKKFTVNCGQSYGEWAEPADVHQMKWTDFASPHPEVSTAYTAYVMGIMAEIADFLGKAEDAELYRKYHEGCRKAYQVLVETREFSLDTDRQAQLVRPLALDLLNEEQKAYAQKRLLQALEHYGWRLGTGFLSTPLILSVLAEYDLDAAYRLLENEDMPGWLYMACNGATTIWESWEGTNAQDGIASLNHYSKGAVCEWLFHTMCGIRPDGENHFIIAPRPGGSFTHAKASYRSVFGLVESGWHRDEGETVFEISVPAGCSARILLPDGTEKHVQAGRHVFERKESGK